jgi:hypothetical protein
MGSVCQGERRGDAPATPPAGERLPFPPGRVPRAVTWPVGRACHFRRAAER